MSEQYRGWRIAPIAAGIVAVLIVLAWLALRGWVGGEAFENKLSAAIADATGREINIGGDIDLSLSLNPTLVLHDIALANTAWGSRPTMLSAARLDVQLALLPLLTGNIHLRRVAASNVDLLLEQHVGHGGNWTLGETPSDAESSDSALPQIDHIRIDGLRLGWRAADTDKPTTYTFARIAVDGLGGAEPVALDVDSPANTLPGLAAWSLQTRVRIDADSYAFDDIVARIGDSDISGQLSVMLQARREQLTGQLTSKRLRTADLRGDAAQADTKPDGASNSRVFSNAPLALTIPQTLFADLSLSVGELALGRLNLNDVAARIAVKQGVLTVSDAAAKTVGGRLGGGATLDTAGSTPSLKLAVHGDDIQVGELLAVLGQPRWLDAAAELRLDLQGHGKSVAAIMGSLDGSTRLLIGKGQAHAGEIDALVGGLHTALGTLIAKDAQRASLNCIASTFAVDNGIATSKLLLADTEHATVFGEGKINLRSEQIDLKLSPKPKSLSLNVAVPVNIGGTLAAPSAKPEQLGLARKGAGLLAAVGAISFPPAILLGLGELGTGDDNPCLRIASGGDRRGSGSTAADGEDKGVVESAGRRIESTLKDAGRSLKSLFD